MISSQLTDRTELIVSWAHEHGYGVRVSSTGGGCEASIRMEHSVAHFTGGELQRVDYRNQGPDPDAMIRELAVLFALCGYLAMIDEAASPFASDAANADAAMLERLHDDLRAPARPMETVKRNAR
ncbi:MAG: hypothetical protein HOP29_10355 [Phycisphaerales bacterium]|nr:hypothetical protein [Phycisphaerales bacterium]